jgi:hypothetical protein
LFAFKGSVLGIGIEINIKFDLPLRQQVQMIEEWSEIIVTVVVAVDKIALIYA